MPLKMTLRRAVLGAFPMLATALWAGSARAQVNEVVVGITPTCPYGLGACWAGAYASLSQLEGVASVTTVPDTYNCTAHIRLKAQSLPDSDAWSKQFQSRVGQAYKFRGIEVTVAGPMSRKDQDLVLRVPGVDQPITLAPLRNKLQWNFGKDAARQPEPDEQAAYNQLAARFKDAKQDDYRVQITGPLQKSASGVSLEVREFFILMPGADPKGRY